MTVKQFTYYIKICERFYDLMPDGSLTTDIIVGFPGETSEQYTETEELYSHIGFDDSYLFIYSKRPGTKAANRQDPIDPVEKYNRFCRLEELKEQIRQRRAHEMSKNPLYVLIEEKQKDILICRADNGWYVQVKDDYMHHVGEFAYVAITSSDFLRLAGIFLTPQNLKNTEIKIEKNTK